MGFLLSNLINTAGRNTQKSTVAFARLKGHVTASEPTKSQVRVPAKSMG